MKTVRYSQAVEWIALHDEAGTLDYSEIVGLVSVLMIADLFDKDNVKVAKDVLKVRLDNEDKDDAQDQSL